MNRVKQQEENAKLWEPSGAEKLLAQQDKDTRSSEIWRLPQVIRHTKMSRSLVYLMASEGTFPKPLRLGRRTAGWLRNEIEAWIMARAGER